MDGEPFAAVLLAGGRSRRMGRDKALLPLPGGGLLWERQLGTLRALGPAELFISGPRRDGFPADVPCLDDPRPDCGPLGGIVGALAATRLTKLAILAIDLPEMTPDFLRALLARAEPGRGVVPRRGQDGFYEPLAAVYPASCRALAEQRLAGGDWSLQSFVRALGGAVSAHDIAPEEERLFLNWNEPAAFSGTAPGA